MSKEDLIEQEIRQYHKQWFAEYVAKTLEIEHRINGGDKCNSIKIAYNCCLDTIVYTDEEIKEIYQQVYSILQNKYKFIIAGCMDDERHIYLVNTKVKGEVQSVKSSYFSRKTNKKTRSYKRRRKKNNH